MVHSFVLIWASHFLWFWFFYLFICFNHFLAACARSQNMKSLWSSKIPSNKNFQITSCVQHSVSRMTWAKADKGNGDGAPEPWASHCDWAFTPPTTHAHTHTHTNTFQNKKMNRILTTNDTLKEKNWRKGLQGTACILGLMCGRGLGKLFQQASVVWVTLMDLEHPLAELLKIVFRLLL